MVGVAQRSGFGIVFAMRFTGIGVFQNVQALGVGGHQAIFDAVVDHFYEMACAGGAAMEIAFFGGAAGFFAAGGAIDISAAGRERFENGVEMFDHVIFAANHLAVAALESPDAAAGADIHVVQTLGG